MCSYTPIVASAMLFEILLWIDHNTCEGNFHFNLLQRAMESREIISPREFSFRLIKGIVK